MAADNVTANAGSGGAIFRTFSDGTNEWPASVVSYVTGGSAGAWTLQQVTASIGLPVSILAGTAVIGHVIVDSGTVTMGAGTAVIGHVIVDSGTITVGGALPPGTNLIGHVITDSGSTTVVTGTVTTHDAPVTTGGLSTSSFLSTSAVQSTAVKNAAGMVYSLEFFNINATPVYVRLYNQATAPLSTDTANIVWRGIVPGNTAGAGFVKTWEKGLDLFSAGIGMRCTAGIADNDATALAASTVIGNVDYK